MEGFTFKYVFAEGRFISVSKAFAAQNRSIESPPSSASRIAYRNENSYFPALWPHSMYVGLLRNEHFQCCGMFPSDFKLS